MHAQPNDDPCQISPQVFNSLMHACLPASGLFSVICMFKFIVVQVFLWGEIHYCDLQLHSRFLCIKCKQADHIWRWMEKGNTDAFEQSTKLIHEWPLPEFFVLYIFFFGFLTTIFQSWCVSLTRHHFVFTLSTLRFLGMTVSLLWNTVIRFLEPQVPEIWKHGG